MLIRLIILLQILRVTQLCSAAMEGFIVGGQHVSIDQYPHSVFVAIECVIGNASENYACGASILTQSFLLSASHCFEDCEPDRSTLAVAVGMSSKRRVTDAVSDVRMHEQYEPEGLANDIAIMVMAKPLRLGDKVKRVILMKFPPMDDFAHVAGWGLTNEEKGIESLTLNEAVQKVLPRDECASILGPMPSETFCANSLGGYAAEGDSGSALMIQKYIQIGIVSYKDVKISVSLVVYTNASSYYDWIKKTMRSMACRNDAGTGLMYYKSSRNSVSYLAGVLSHIIDGVAVYAIIFKERNWITRTSIRLFEEYCRHGRRWSGRRGITNKNVTCTSKYFYKTKDGGGRSLTIKNDTCIAKYSNETDDGVKINFQAAAP